MDILKYYTKQINMSKPFCFFCLVLILYLKLFNAAIIPLRSLIPSTSTYKPSTLLLPPGFDSQKAPREPMLYPYAVSPSGLSTRSQSEIITSTTPGWIPVALRAHNDLPLKRNFHSTTPSSPVPVLENRISNNEQKYTSPAYNGGPVFESIVYGTWKPDPPLQPVKVLNNTKQQQIHGIKSNVSASIKTGGNVADGKFYNKTNKTINRQHGGFIGNIQQKLMKSDKQIPLKTFLSSVENKSKNLTQVSTDLKLQTKVKKQGRRKIHPITLTSENDSMQKNSNSEEVATRKKPRKENVYNQENVIKVNSTDPKLMEVVKQINESLGIKYNNKQTSTHSIDVMTTTDAYNDNDYADTDNVQWATKSNEFFSTEPEEDYDDYTEEEFENISATRRSWPTDFMEEPLTTTDKNFQSLNNSNKFDNNDGLETDPSEIPLALSALNIPPSLWPKLPGNITKLGRPYEAENSAEESAVCVPITVREQNIVNLNELVYIERVFCFPRPAISNISENNVRSLESSLMSSTTLKTVTTTKVQNFDDSFVGSNSKVFKANIFKNHVYLASSVLVIYFKFIF